MPVRMTFDMSKDTAEALEQIRETFGAPNKAATIGLLIALHQMKSTQAPIVAVLDGMEILNAAAVKEREAQHRLDAHALSTQLVEVKAAHANEKNKVLKRFWDSLELKPGLFGFRVDLKKLMGLDGSNK